MKPISPNPKAEWIYTWESQSHTPTLRLLIFDLRTNPKLDCEDLQIRLLLEESAVLATWVGENEARVSVRVPIPRRVLLDAEAQLSFKAADDHIVVKLVLLLPVDHPIVLSFDEGEDCDEMRPLPMDSELTQLSSGKALDFHCRNCAHKLTGNPISCFVEMPSTDWRESADNWFGGCCCSFGGVSEKLVNGYANSYSCAMGKCLVNSTSVVICMDDLLGGLVSDGERNGKDECCNIGENNDGMTENSREVDISAGSKHLNGKLGSFVDKTMTIEKNGDNISCHRPLLNGNEELTEVQPCHGVKRTTDRILTDETHTDHSCITSEDCCVSEGFNENYTPDQKFLLNGLLENIFMIKSSYLSKVVEWKEVSCPKCSFLLGAYPSSVSGGRGPLDGGIRFFKCCISTCSQPNDSSNVFRKYTLQKMFTSQLLESAKDELMFRTIVRDLKSNAPALQIVMLNPNSWSYSGSCSDSTKLVSNIKLRPVMKVLFSHSSDLTTSKERHIENRVRNNNADEVYMFSEQIRELIDFLEAGKTTLPPSCGYLQGLPLSCLPQ